MAKYEIQIKNIINSGRINTPPEITWKSVHPTNQLPYRMNTIEEAKELAMKWYPTCIWNEDIRAKKVSD